MTITYNENIPDGPHNPSSDWSLMQENTNSIPAILAVDHFPFTSPVAGTHAQVNLTNESSPSLLSNLVLYSNTSGGQSTLWAKNSTQDLPLFTGSATGATNGFTSMYGGIIIQWGFVSWILESPPSFGTVTFVPGNRNFNNIFNVSTTVSTTVAATPSSAITIAVTSIDTTNFTWKYVSSTDKTNGFYWIAIGN